MEVYRKALSGVEGITLCPEQANVKSNYSYFPIVVDPERFGMDRDELQKKLLERGILARKYFYPATNEFGCYQGKFDLQSTPVARKLAQQVLVLPLYPELTEAEVEEICALIVKEKI